MDAIREQLNRPLIVGLAGLIVGTLFGLIVLGWWLWPVEWTDARPQDLHFEAKVEYLRMAIEAYAANGNAERAVARYQALGEEADDALSEVVRNPAGLPPDAIQAFGATVLAGTVPGVEEPLAPTPGVETPAAAGETPVAPTPLAEEEPTAGGFIRSLLTVLCAITLVLAAALIVLFVVRSRGGARGYTATNTTAQQPTRQAAWTDYTASGEEAPLVQFMSSFSLGDNAFNESFGIESPSGEYLGECGAEISDVIVVGEPKKVTAFEVWLFDKNDYQTLTKVLMSEHAFSDPNIRERLAAKGSPVLAVPHGQTVLETQTLRMVAHIVDMSYGDGILPAQSYFDRFVVELSVWSIRPEPRPVEG